jgi:hypothetical protein
MINGKDPLHGRDREGPRAARGAFENLNTGKCLNVDSNPGHLHLAVEVFRGDAGD